MISIFRSALIAALLSSGAVSHAAIIQANTYNGTSTGLPVLNNDLLQTNLLSTTSAGSIGSFGSGTLAALTNGVLGTAGAVFQAQNVAPGSGSTITFTLDTSVNPQGYDIASILTTASWDTGRDGQQYTVSYATVANPGIFNNLISIASFNPTGVPFNPSTTQVLLTETGGILATGVSALRFSFTDFENSGTAYREIDVTGTAVTISEPAILPLFLCGLGLVLTLNGKKCCFV